MQPRTHLILASLVALGLLAWASVNRPAHNPAACDTDSPVALATTSSTAEIQCQFAAMERDRLAGLAELSRRANDAARRVRAGARTAEERQYLQVSRSPDWSKFLHAHWHDYQALRAKAAASPNGETPCMVCNGRGSLDSCFLCGGTGICPTCQGTGKLAVGSDELCPTCLGSGKCYLCAGTGRMICPFCNDGMVDIHAPIPPNLLPLMPAPIQP